MILLLGGTSEAGKIAAAMEKAGIGVVVSTATGFETGWTRQARLGAPTDIDVYRVLKGGNPLPVGSQLGITLKAGADYDVVVLAKLVSVRGAPRYLRSDNGPEFVSSAVLRWLSEAGIDTAHIAPGKPWQNGTEPWRAEYAAKSLRLKSIR